MHKFFIITIAAAYSQFESIKLMDSEEELILVFTLFIYERMNKLMHMCHRCTYRPWVACSRCLQLAQK